MSKKFLLITRCHVCGERINRETYDRQNKIRFCSKQCAAIHMQNKVRENPKLKKLICRFCGNVFYDYESEGRKYCSTDCSNKGRTGKKTKEQKQINCRGCGKGFFPKKFEAYCSTECKRLNFWISLKCHVCDENFERRKYLVEKNKSGKFFCSLECRIKGGASIQRKKPEPWAKRIKYKCDQCGESIERRERERRDHQKKIFCSKDCSFEYRKEFNKYCVDCGELLTDENQTYNTSIRGHKKRPVCDLCMYLRKQKTRDKAQFGEENLEAMRKIRFIEAVEYYNKITEGGRQWPKNRMGIKLWIEKSLKSQALKI